MLSTNNIDSESSCSSLSISVSQSTIEKRYPRTSYTRALKLVGGQAIPNFLDRVAEIIGGFLNNLILARSNNPYVFPASDLTSIVQSFFITVDSVALTAVGSDVGENKDNHPKKVGEIFRNGILFSTIMIVPTVTIMVVSKPIIRGLGQEEEIAELVQQYFRAYAPCVPVTLWLSVEKQVVAGLYEQPYSIMAVEILSAGLTTALAYLAVNGKGGFPELGIAGLGYADTISSSFCLMGYTAYLAYAERFRQYELFKRSFYHKEIFHSLWSNGLPVAIQFGIEMGTLVGATLLVGKLGDEYLASQQVCLQYILLILAPIISIARANLVCIAQAIGRDDLSAIIPINIISNLLGLIVTGISAILFTSAGASLTQLFIDNNDPDLSPIN